MKTWLVKYETYDGNVQTVTVKHYDKQSALSQLVNCKEIYWIKNNNQ